MTWDARTRARIAEERRSPHVAPSREEVARYIRWYRYAHDRAPSQRVLMARFRVGPLTARALLRELA